MGSLWRSKSMALVQMFIPTDTLHRAIAELGKMDAVQFIDVSL